MRVRGGAPRSPREQAHYRGPERTRPRGGGGPAHRVEGHGTPEGPPARDGGPPFAPPQPGWKTAVGVGSYPPQVEAVGAQGQPGPLSQFCDPRSQALALRGCQEGPQHAGKCSDRQAPSLPEASGGSGLLGPARPSARIQSPLCDDHNSSSHHLLSSEGLPDPSAKCTTRIIPLNSHSDSMKKSRCDPLRKARERRIAGGGVAGLGSQPYGGRGLGSAGNHSWTRPRALCCLGAFPKAWKAWAATRARSSVICGPAHGVRRSRGRSTLERMGQMKGHPHHLWGLLHFLLGPPVPAPTPPNCGWPPRLCPIFNCLLTPTICNLIHSHGLGFCFSPTPSPASGARPPSQAQHLCLDEDIDVTQVK